MVRILVLMTVFLMSCTSSSKVVSKSATIAATNPLDHITYIPIVPKKGYDDSLFTAIENSKTEIKLEISGKIITEYETLNVWRVQVAALTDLDQAKDIQEKAKAALNSKVIVKEINSFQKVLAGEFRIRAKADQFMYDVRNQGYPSAWVVADEIRVVKGSYKPMKDETIDFTLYRIQVGSYSSEIAANKVKTKLETLSKDRVLVYKKGNLFKVLAGESIDKSSLINLSKLIEENGFKTWISNKYK